MQKIFDQEGYELFIEVRAELHRVIEECGDTPVSRETEMQLNFYQERLLARSKQIYWHAIDDVAALRRILEKSLQNNQ